MNESADGIFEGCERGSLLDQTTIKVTFICIYLMVFFVCLIGNLFAIIVICLHKSMRTSTNFFLGNLAFADLLVAIFCILQNMFHIVAPSGSWVFGDVVCKLYIFIQHFSPCVVIGILVCVSLEKYVAVLHPLLSMKLLTPRLRITMMTCIWLISLIFNLPYYFTSRAQTWGKSTSCVRAFDGPISVRTVVTVSFFAWYCIPLVIMAYLYSRIGLVLWKSSLKPLEIRYSADSNGTCTATINFESEALNENGNHLNTANRNITEDPPSNTQINNVQTGAVTSELIESRKKIIRLLIVIVLSFAILTLPQHLRLLYNEWSGSHICLGSIEILIQPSSYLLLFISTGLNPIVYAFMSKRFRGATRDLLNCKQGTRKFTRTRTICSEVAQEHGSRSPSLHTRTTVQQSRS